MNKQHRLVATPLLALAGAGVACAVCAAPVPGTTCNVLPADNVWNTDISSLPVHPSSAAWLNSMSASTKGLHPDFGASPYGIPFIVVDNSHATEPVSFTYASESDPGPYPFDGQTPIEGGVSSSGDRHALMINKDTCVLYELYAAYWNNGAPTAGSGAVFNLASNALRPAGWTSADAAGLPIFPGLVRYDEVQAGAIHHAIRFTTVRTDRSYLWPARHQAGSASDPTLPPMGARFRLKAGFDVSPYSAQAQVILTAMKHYGMIVADNGSDWFFQGTEDSRWGDDVLNGLKSVPASEFEAVDESSLIIDPDSGQARTAGSSSSSSSSSGAGSSSSSSSGGPSSSSSGAASGSSSSGSSSSSSSSGGGSSSGGNSSGGGGAFSPGWLLLLLGLRGIRRRSVTRRP